MQRACPLEPAFAWSATASLAPLISVKGALTRGKRKRRKAAFEGGGLGTAVWRGGGLKRWVAEQWVAERSAAALLLAAPGLAWCGLACPTYPSASRAPAPPVCHIAILHAMQTFAALAPLLRPCPQAATATSTAAASAAGSCGARCLQPRAGGGRWSRASVCAGWQVGGMCAWADGWADRHVADCGWRRLLGCGIGLLGGAGPDLLAIDNKFAVFDVRAGLEVG